jgi:hypothetical protein
MHRTIALLITLITACYGSHAQLPAAPKAMWDASLRVTVRDSLTGQLLEDATVSMIRNLPD